jgi:hypothetical protein
MRPRRSRGVWRAGALPCTQAAMRHKRRRLGNGRIREGSANISGEASAGAGWQLPGSCLTSTLSLKALAWSKAAWPMLPSITKMTRSGATATATCTTASATHAAARHGRAWQLAAVAAPQGAGGIGCAGAARCPTCRISSNSAASCLCLPEVSTIIKSRPSVRNRSTPCSVAARGGGVRPACACARCSTQVRSGVGAASSMHPPTWQSDAAPTRPCECHACWMRGPPPPLPR